MCVCVCVCVCVCLRCMLKNNEAETLLSKTEMNNEWNVIFPSEYFFWYVRHLFHQFFHESKHLWNLICFEVLLIKCIETPDKNSWEQASSQLDDSVTYPWYTDMWNKHRESKNTKLYEINSGTKAFITFELKVIQHERRERHNLSMQTAFTSSALNPSNARCP